MNWMRRLVRCAPLVKVAAVFAAALVLVGGGGPAAPLANAAGASISGSGSTWSYNAVAQWITDVKVQGTIVNFLPNGSGEGRRQFAGGGVDFANSDIPYQGKDPLTGTDDSSTRRQYAYIPIISGGTALMYQLRRGNDLIRNVRLSGDTIAKIFTGKITNWNDEQIKRDMNGQSLPAKPIKVIVDSGGGGTTAQFTDWLVHEHGDIWGPYAGENKPTSFYPTKAPNMVNTPGDDTIARTITAPQYDGAIGYTQYSYALNANYPVVKVLNAGHYYTSPLPSRVAKALTQADIEYADHDPKVYLTQKLDRVYPYTAPEAYRLSSYSYMIIPIDPKDRWIDDARARTFANFSYYSLCDGQGKAVDQGYAPLPLKLVTAAFDQIATFSHMLPEYRSNRNPKTCKNPTFDMNNFDNDKLAELAMVPPNCDKEGQGPCNDDGSDPIGPGGSGGGGAGGGNGQAAPGAGTGNGNGAGPGASNSGSGASGDPANGGGAAGTGPAADPANGGSGSRNGSSSSLAGASSEVAAFRTRTISTVMGVLAAALLVLCLLAPAFVGRAAERRQVAKQKRTS